MNAENSNNPQSTGCSVVHVRPSPFMVTVGIRLSNPCHHTKGEEAIRSLTDALNSEILSRSQKQFVFTPPISVFGKLIGCFL